MNIFKGKRNQKTGTATKWSMGSKKKSLNSCKKEFDQYMKGIVWHLGCKSKGLNWITQKNQSYLLMSMQFSIGMFKERK